MSLDQELRQPPRAPATRRSIRLHPFQWVGVPILVLPLALAAFGVFGQTEEQAEVRTARFAAEVHWPSHFRYKQLNDIRVHVQARSALDTLTLALDSAYAARFSTVRAIPAFAEPYRLSLTALEPGQERLAIIEIQAERYWRHAGTLTISAGADTARVRLSSFIFP